MISHSANAHGPTPAGVDIVVSSDSSAQLVKLNRGAALRSSQGWMYLCPALWGGPEAPLIAASDNSTVWIAASSSIQKLELNPKIQPIEAPTLNSSTVRTMARLGSSVIALTGFNNYSAVWRLQGSTIEQVIETTFIGALAVEDKDILTLTTVGEQLQISRYDVNGTATTPPLIIDGKLEGDMSLEPVGSDLYLRVRMGELYTLYRLSGSQLVTVITSENPIHGPVKTSEGQVLVIVDHNLGQLQDDKLSLADTQHWFTCLGHSPSLGAYACIDANIVAISSALAADLPLFALTELNEPNYSEMTDDVRDQCEIEWLDLVVDAGFGIASARTKPVSPQSDANENTQAKEMASYDAQEPQGNAQGCSSSLNSNCAPGTTLTLILVLLLFLWATRWLNGHLHGRNHS